MLFLPKKLGPLLPWCNPIAISFALNLIHASFAADLSLVKALCKASNTLVQGSAAAFSMACSAQAEASIQLLYFTLRRINSQAQANSSGRSSVGWHGNVGVSFLE